MRFHGWLIAMPAWVILGGFAWGLPAPCAAVQTRPPIRPAPAQPLREPVARFQNSLRDPTARTQPPAESRSTSGSLGDAPPPAPSETSSSRASGRQADGLRQLTDNRPLPRQPTAGGAPREVRGENSGAIRLAATVGGRAEVSEDESESNGEPLPVLPTDPEQIPAEAAGGTRRLPPPSQAEDAPQGGKGPLWAQPPITSTLLSLAVVLGAFFVLAWFVKRNRPAGSGRLPDEAVEVLGRIPWEGKQQLQLVRFGPKLLLIVVGAGGAETLSELTDPEDVEQMLEICQRTQPGSVSDSFRQVLAQLGDEPTNRGFLNERSLEEVVAGTRSTSRNS